MRLFRRRSTGTPKEAALAEARSAAKIRREKAKAERYRAKKQANPADEMTTNQWIGNGS